VQGNWRIVSVLKLKIKYKIMAGIVEYVKESFGELKNNVSWPTWAEGQSLTVLVAVFSIIFSLAIWGVDTVFARVIEEYFNWIK
jgi:preprotein translocase subunit SecE